MHILPLDPMVIQIIGCIALGCIGWFSLSSVKHALAWRREVREDREAAAAAQRAEQAADRFISRAKPSTAAAAPVKRGRHAPVTNPVPVARPKTAPVAAAPNSARAATSTKWEPFSDFL